MRDIHELMLKEQEESSQKTSGTRNDLPDSQKSSTSVKDSESRYKTLRAHKFLFV